MNVRASNPSDKPTIISLLKLSLGEGLLKKSQTVWDFKHEQNPFGASYVLLGFEATELIGVRALMQWRWQQGTQQWIAYRAVDTATHPEHQGKGIFKELTLQALDDVAAKGDCFIFNTPNDKSRPGYLKMGWQEVSAIPLALIPMPVYAFHYLFTQKQTLGNTITPNRLEEICQLHNAVLSKKNSIFTPKSATYLKWRFEDNPMQDYVVVSNENWYVAMYVKQHRYFKELRVVEIISANPKADYAAIRKAVIQWAFQSKCWLVTSADKGLFGFRIFGNFGPKLTFKPLTQDTEFSKNALQIDHWDYSLGDLELF